MRKRFKFNLEHQGIRYDFWRLDYDEYLKLTYNDNGVRIKYDYCCELDLPLAHDREDCLNLATMFVTLERLLGPTNDFYDHTRGSFCYHLLMVLRREGGTFFYVLRIYDDKSCPYFCLYRVLDRGNEGFDTSTYVEPFEAEFSLQEISDFYYYFYCYLLQCFKNWREELRSQTFLNLVTCYNILYGCKEGEFFQTEYKTEKQYYKAMRTFMKTYGDKIVDPNAGGAEVRALLEDIMDEPVA